MSFYFDHNSCTPVDPRVLERFLRVEADHPGNPASLHRSGRGARGVVEEARDQIAELLGVVAEQVVFVSGGTEANNIAVLGSGDPDRPVLCAPVEHPSVLASAERRGIEPWSVDDDAAAVVTPPDRPVGMIALVHGQSEVGTLQPLSAAHRLAGELGVPLHVDAAQTLGRCPLADAVAMADTVTLSAHKAGGLRGTGVLIDKRTHPRPLFFGGGQQGDRRPGTESPSLAAATALAIALAIAEQPARAAAMRAARDAFADELRIAGADHLTPAAALPNTIMIRFGGVDGRELLPALDVEGVEASQGSACSSGSPTPPAVLAAMGMDVAAARSCVRFSFSAHTTVDEAVEGARVVKRVILRMRAR